MSSVQCSMQLKEGMSSAQCSMQLKKVCPQYSAVYKQCKEVAL